MLQTAQQREWYWQVLQTQIKTSKPRHITISDSGVRWMHGAWTDLYRLYEGPYKLSEAALECRELESEARSTDARIDRGTDPVRRSSPHGSIGVTILLTRRSV
jgi:hypothetical protein